MINNLAGVDYNQNIAKDGNLCMLLFISQSLLILNKLYLNYTYNRKKKICLVKNAFFN